MSGAAKSLTLGVRINTKTRRHEDTPCSGPLRVPFVSSGCPLGVFVLIPFPALRVVLAPAAVDAGVAGAGGVEAIDAVRLRGAPVVEERDRQLGGLDLGRVGLGVEATGGGERR